MSDQLAALMGPIPARAGEPLWDQLSGRVRWAYPRSRGGTRDDQFDVLVFLGLSPLARGNHLRKVDRAHHPGPIPARAGEPS